MPQRVSLSSFITEVARKAGKELTVPLQETTDGFGATEDLRAPVSADDIVYNAGFPPDTTMLEKVKGDGFCFFNSLAASMHGDWTPEAIRLFMKSSAEDETSYEAVRQRIVSDSHPNIAQDEFKDSLMDYGQSEHTLFVKSLQSRVASRNWPDIRHAVYAAFMLQREITVLCMDFSKAAQAYGCPRIWKFNPDARRGAGLVKVDNHFDAIISDTFVQTPQPQQRPGVAAFFAQIYRDWAAWFSTAAVQVETDGAIALALADWDKAQAQIENDAAIAKAIEWANS